MSHRVPVELVRHVAASTGLPEPTAARVVTDVVEFFSETTEDYVRRRHTELRQRGRRNSQIWELLGAELARRPVAAGTLSERQLRRIVYG
ncbi:hypothetical protein GIY23_05855 [Allosaccharopolyspora coralli]|uniref:Uncharacterized protein n=1 Tax=Allosaccharopolyspora coralli TaxID=2665642 RepID=A0A5Q3Q3V4_9PSEU|nr:hypothetical protein [Allosaccharopolyspora coralli]QGK69122.1 hypothetical protein GIY23_05855 [Allosaccharopolyspora coralli]